ncbi:anthrone oxygenase family protein [Streptomyces sp. TRM 70361]|uniref:anthrone oxygenase family protein n=1 Tax=Streptomyces sp. TRM 70361 TaxID=3116553 RepID=UPI002E7C3B8B|nr:anthrone oxygenase family protein [Streptomyces sp. TRM 70361]MEE1938018.1 anthrone oxygenase family protein [Streptomyces sp. TRM 70361]
MVETVRTASLVAATVTMGLVGGLFYAYACSVMRALRGVEDRTFVEVMQRVNVAILNGWFLFGYLGALLFTGLAAALHLPGGERDVLPPVLAALVLYLAAMGVTARVSIPLNNALEAAGDPARIADPGGVRGNFEAAWNRWNTVRAVLCCLALGCLCWALLLSGAAG